MSFLQQIINEKKDDLSVLPVDVVSELKKNITAGAKDLSLKWHNALTLVHKAYSVADVQRPDPSMKSAWENYEEMIAFAVKQLSKFRGTDSDWRMRSSSFSESIEEKLITFKVQRISNNSSESYNVKAKNIKQLIAKIENRVPKKYTTNVNYMDNDEAIQTAILSFTEWGIMQDLKIKIQQK